MATLAASTDITRLAALAGPAVLIGGVSVAAAFFV
jgi:hypothetical protein